VARYDRSAPAVLRAVVRPPRELANPFYYHDGSPAEEALATYERLLRRLAADDVQVLVLHARPEIVDVVERVGAPNVVGVLAPRTERYPYAAPGGHYSAFGNRWVAEQYFAWITHGTYRPTLLEFERAPAGSRTTGAAPGSEEPVPIDSYDAIELRLAGRSAGLLAIASTNPGQRVGTPADLRGSGVTSLLALTAPAASVVDAAVVPVRARLRDGDPLVLRSVRGGAAVEVTLGEVRVLEPTVAFGVADVPGLELAGEVRLHPSERLAADALAPGSDVVVAAGESVVLRGRAGDWPLRLRPADSRDRLRNFRVGGGAYVDVDRLAPGGVVSLVLHAAARTSEVPVATWRMLRGEAFAGARSLARRLDLSGSRAELRDAAPALDDAPARPPNWGEPSRTGEAGS
jgi:hypothetical protein